MADAVFTTWTALLEQMRNDLMSGNWRRVQSYTLGTPSGPNSIQYRSLTEFMELLTMVEARALAEQHPDGLRVCAVAVRG